MKAALILTLGSISVTLDAFTEENLPRLPIYEAEGGYTVAGYPRQKGPYYAPKHLWRVGALVTDDSSTPATTKYRALCCLWEEADYRRRTNAAPWIELQDLTQPFRERSARTRSTCPSPNNTVLTVTYGSLIYQEYFARFWVRFASPIEATPLIGGFIVNFTLEEGPPYLDN